MFASVTAFGGGFVIGDSDGFRAYPWCAYASNRFIPAFFAARRNTSGEIVERLHLAQLFPPGEVTPHATFSFVSIVEWMPV